ncbi:MAG: SDR family oxidoreductase [Verrucomicrobia bacterium]|nr:SDR family oxidoreductase [Verrucomicrobiota bacterium]
MKPVVWITGAGGLIGNYLVQTAAQFASQFQVVGLTRAQLDLTDYAAVRAEFQHQQPQLVIHCAAMSRSPDCQRDPVLARKLNTEVPSQLAGIALKVPFVFFSTDLVFDGQKGNYVETDAVNSISVYGETKAIAEDIVSRHPYHLIIRTALNAGVSPPGDRGFDEQLRLIWKRGEAAKLFTDEFRCPIPAAATARAVWELVQKKQTGIFHVCGSEKLSRLEIGKLLAARSPELKPQIIADTLKNYHGAPRSPDVSMNCAKAQAVLSFPLPKFSEWLAAQSA